MWSSETRSPALPPRLRDRYCTVLYYIEYGTVQVSDHEALAYTDLALLKVRESLQVSTKAPSETLGPAERIVAAGRKLFFEKGFQNVSTDMLAREAKVSKASIYKYFPDMAGILVAVTSAEAVHFFAPEPVTIDSREALRSELIRFGTALLKFLNRAEIVRFTQLMYEQARENHEAAGQFYDAAYGETLAHLATLLREGQEIDALRSAQSPEDLAAQLVGMWEFIPMVRVQMGKARKPFASPEAWATKCVDTLLSS